MKYKYSKSHVRNFWNTHGMTYDWYGVSEEAEGTAEFFDRIDKVMWNAHRFAAQEGIPFGKYIPFSDIKDKKVLEIGCGMGSHAQLLALHGAEVTGVDLTEKAIRNTKKRFEILKERYPNMENINKCKFLQSDAEDLPFESGTFDFVWSWGVIHHSPDTKKIVSEIHRVLKKDGHTSGMVYHRNSIVYYVHYMFLRGVLMGKLLKHNQRELADRYSDGWQHGGCPKAEHFSKNEWQKIMQERGFSLKKPIAAGNVKEIYPPHTSRLLQAIIPSFIPNTVLKFFGWFLIWNMAKKK